MPSWCCGLAVAAPSLPCKEPSWAATHSDEACRSEVRRESAAGGELWWLPIALRAEWTTHGACTCACSSARFARARARRTLRDAVTRQRLAYVLNLALRRSARPARARARRRLRGAATRQRLEYVLKMALRRSVRPLGRCLARCGRPSGATRPDNAFGPNVLF